MNNINPNSEENANTSVSSLEQTGNTSKNSEEELSGGLKNAMERGQPLAKAVQSFINAGYNPQQVQSAAKKLSFNQPPKTEINTTDIEIPKVQLEQKKSNKKIYIITGIICILILVSAVILGLFWDSIF